VLDLLETRVLLGMLVHLELQEVQVNRDPMASQVLWVLQDLQVLLVLVELLDLLEFKDFQDLLGP